MTAYPAFLSSFPVGSGLSYAPVVITSSPVAVPADFLGINSNQYPGGSGPSSAAPTFGYGALRTNDYLFGGWRGINTANGVYDWSLFDQIASVPGKTCMFTLWGTPVWALKTAGDSSFNGPDGNPGSAGVPTLPSLSTFATALCTRKKGLIVEVWNEPNFAQNHSGFFWGSAADLVDMVATVYAAAKAADPTCKVIGPGFILTSAIAPFLNTQGPTTGKFGREVIDGFSLHPYYSLPTYQAALNQGSPVSTRVGDVQAALAAAGIPSLPIYTNEYGAGTSSVDGATLAFQALPAADRRNWIRRLLGIYASMGVKGAYLYAYGPASVCLAGDLVNDTAGVIAAMNDVSSTLVGKAITSAIQAPDGTLTIVVNGTTVVW